MTLDKSLSLSGAELTLHKMGKVTVKLKGGDACHVFSTVLGLILMKVYLPSPTGLALGGWGLLWSPYLLS